MLLCVVCLVAVDDLENRFPFNRDLPPPDMWRPGPKTYPSQTAKTKSESALHVWVGGWVGLLIIGLFVCAGRRAPPSPVGGANGRAAPPPPPPVGGRLGPP